MIIRKCKLIFILAIKYFNTCLINLKYLYVYKIFVITRSHLINDIFIIIFKSEFGEKIFSLAILIINLYKNLVFNEIIDVPNILYII